MFWILQSISLMAGGFVMASTSTFREEDETTRQSTTTRYEDSAVVIDQTLIDNLPTLNSSQNIEASSNMIGYDSIAVNGDYLFAVGINQESVEVYKLTPKTEKDQEKVHNKVFAYLEPLEPFQGVQNTIQSLTVDSQGDTLVVNPIYDYINHPNEIPPTLIQLDIFSLDEKETSSGGINHLQFLDLPPRSDDPTWIAPTGVFFTVVHNNTLASIAVADHGSSYGDIRICQRDKQTKIWNQVQELEIDSSRFSWFNKIALDGNTLVLFVREDRDRSRHHLLIYHRKREKDAFEVIQDSVVEDLDTSNRRRRRDLRSGGCGYSVALTNGTIVVAGCSQIQIYHQQQDATTFSLSWDLVQIFSIDRADENLVSIYDDVFVVTNGVYSYCFENCTNQQTILMFVRDAETGLWKLLRNLVVVGLPSTTTWDFYSRISMDEEHIALVPGHWRDIVIFRYRESFLGTDDTGSTSGGNRFMFGSYLLAVPVVVLGMTLF